MPRKKKIQHGDGLYDEVANRVFGSKLAKGELHIPQYTKDGFRFGKFIGPGTDVYGGIRKGAKPVSETDKTAKLHDIMFSLANNPEEVRLADLRMVKNLNRIQKEKKDYRFNISLGKLPIKAKMFLEDWGVFRKGSFSGMNGSQVSKENRELLENEKAKLTQEGYGKKKTSWMTHVSKIRVKNPGKSYKECLKLASVSYKKH
jgi:hypothetical protein